MKEFNWDKFINFNNKIAVHCKTEKEAKDFCKRMSEQGIVWVTTYDKHRESTCYTGLGICIGYNSCKYYGYKILEWSDYMKNEFTKADLKDGMVVEYRNANRFIVFSDRLLNNDGYDKLEDVKEDLTDNKFEDRMYDIMKVYKIKPEKVFCIDDIFNDENLELIWERNESKKMTTEEMRKKLEELTGEKIEVEPSREEMIGSIQIYCNNRPCSDCIIHGNVTSCDIVNISTEQLKECYEKIRDLIV